MPPPTRSETQDSASFDWVKIPNDETFGSVDTDGRSIDTKIGASVAASTETNTQAPVTNFQLSPYPLPQDNGDAFGPCDVQIYHAMPNIQVPENLRRNNSITAPLLNLKDPQELVTAMQEYITTSRPARKRALLIGICYYDILGYQLAGDHVDLKRMEKLVRSKGYDTRVLIDERNDDPESPTRPTRQNVLRSMRELAEDARPGDQLFFYFSGHGDQRPDEDGDEADGQDETILPVDWNIMIDESTNSEIVDDDMWRIMLKPLPEGCHFTALFDCCHSGTALDLRFELTNSISIRVTGAPLESSMETLADMSASVRSLPSGSVILEQGRITLEIAQKTRKGKPKPKLKRTGTLDLQNIYLYEPRSPIQAPDAPGKVVLTDSDSTTFDRTPQRKSTFHLKCLGPESRDINAHVVCWSACPDDESAWGDDVDGGAMAHAFIESIKELNEELEGRDPTYGEFLKKLTLNLRQYYKTVLSLEGLDHPQRPQLSSSKRIDVEREVFSF